MSIEEGVLHLLAALAIFASLAWLVHRFLRLPPE